MMDPTELATTVIAQAHTIRHLTDELAAANAQLATEQAHCERLQAELAGDDHAHDDDAAVVPSSSDASPGSGDDASDAAAAD